MGTVKRSAKRKRIEKIPPPPGHTRIDRCPLKNDHPLVRAFHRDDVKLTDRLRRRKIKELEAGDGKGTWSDGEFDLARKILEASYPLSDEQREQVGVLLSKGGRR